MTNTPFELFKPEHFKPMIGRTDCKPENLACFIANRIVNEYVRVGHTTLSKDTRLPEHVYNDMYDYSTHRIYYFLRPIEEEKAECDLDHKTVRTILKMKELSLRDIDVGINMECPKCGKELDG